jgi:hypothetical protein
MTLDGWRACVRKAADDPMQLELLAKLLFEQDWAKQILRDKGYGCTGMGWVDTVNEIPTPRRGDE